MKPQQATRSDTLWDDDTVMGPGYTLKPWQNQGMQPKA